MYIYYRILFLSVTLNSPVRGNWKSINFLAKTRGEKVFADCNISRARRWRKRSPYPPPPLFPVREMWKLHFRVSSCYRHVRVGIPYTPESIAYIYGAFAYVYVRYPSNYRSSPVLGPRSSSPPPSLSRARGAGDSPAGEIDFPRMSIHSTSVSSVTIRKRLLGTPLCKFAPESEVRTRNSLRLLLRFSCCCKEPIPETNND